MHQQTARVGKNNRAEVVKTPLGFCFPPETKEVFIRKLGDDIVLSPSLGIKVHFWPQSLV